VTKSFTKIGKYWINVIGNNSDGTRRSIELLALNARIADFEYVMGESLDLYQFLYRDRPFAVAFPFDEDESAELRLFSADALDHGDSLVELIQEKIAKAYE
jgi:hypothetical protein